MCGIMGYAGFRQATPVLLDGLKRLEYRGYDSAGIAVVGDDGVVRVARSEGKLGNLTARLAADPPPGRFGIGHTRWATHGRPSEENAHPHRDASGRVVVIHNGIIENFLSLKRELVAEGVKFLSETDTEVVAQALGAERRKTPEAPFVEIVRRVALSLKGMYALVLFSADEPGVLYAAKWGPPIVLGKGEGENFIASDATALVPLTRDLIFLEDGDLARVTASGDHDHGLRRLGAVPARPARPLGRGRGREGRLPALHGEGDRRAAHRRRRDDRQQGLPRDGPLQRGGDGRAARSSRDDRTHPHRGVRHELARGPRREVPPRGDRPRPVRGRTTPRSSATARRSSAEDARPRHLAVGRDGRHGGRAPGSQAPRRARPSAS